MDPPTTPAANALAHGLTARKFLPAELAAAVAQYREALFSELAPQGALAEILVAELARHAGAMQIAETAEAAAMRVAEQSAATLDMLGALPESDRPYVASMASEIVERTARYRRHHERSFFAALAQLQEQRRAPPPPIEPEKLFASDEDCNAYLRQWQQKQKFECPHCQGRKRITLHSRNAFECATCHRQYSNRWGTIFANSRVPLLTWFAVIQRVAMNPAVAIDELVKVTPIVRRATITLVRRNVIAALGSPAADRLLAGVNRLGLQRPRTWAKRTVDRLPHKTNGSLADGSVLPRPAT